ncbi:hypothetical protein QE152_g1985 [Popillia japonica]|uniref:Uncharacterized protein n=1 Tax=Popillia japonica TaxID=7064 RepID=A0AAW1N4D6_POPJA
MASRETEYRKKKADVAPLFTILELKDATDQMMLGKTPELNGIPPLELKDATDQMMLGKTPELNGIPPEAIKETVRSHGGWLLKVLNQLLKTQRFPAERKDRTEDGF